MSKRVSNKKGKHQGARCMGRHMRQGGGYREPITEEMKIDRKWGLEVFCSIIMARAKAFLFPK